MGPMIRNRILPLLLCPVILATPARPAPGQAPAAQQPAADVPYVGPDAEAVDGLPVLKKLLHGGRLRLSLDESSASDRFYFGLVAYVRSPQAGTQSTEFAVWREGEKFLLWSWSRQGNQRMPACTVTDGLFVGLDQKNPGGVVMFEGGHPEVVFSATDDRKGGRFAVTYHPTGRDAAVVVFDAKAIIQSSFESMVTASYDEKAKAIRVQTRRMRMEIKPEDDPKQPCAVRSLRVTGQTQAMGFWLSNVKLDPPPRVDNFTAANVEVTGLPVRRLSEGDVDEFKPYFDVPLPDFNSDARHRQAAGKVWSLMRPAEPAKDSPKKEQPKFEPTLEF